MIQKTKKIIYLIILFSYLVFPFPYLSAGFNIGIKEDIAYAWMLTEYDSEITENFKEEEQFKIPTHDFGVYEGMEFRWEIWELNERKDNLTEYYGLDYALCRATENTTEQRLSARCFSGFKAQIGKDPEFVGNELLKVKSNYSFTLMFITQDVEGYLEGILRGLPISLQNRFSIKERTLFYEHTVSGGTYEMMIEYNELGIQKNFSLTFNGKSFYSYYYLGTYIETSEYNPFLLLLIFVAVLGIVILIAMGLSFAQREEEKKKNPKRIFHSLLFLYERR